MTYTYEHNMFSRMKVVKSKTRTRLTDINFENSLLERIASSRMQPNTNKSHISFKKSMQMIILKLA